MPVQRKFGLIMGSDMSELTGDAVGGIIAGTTVPEVIRVD